MVRIRRPKTDKKQFNKKVKWNSVFDFTHTNPVQLFDTSNSQYIHDNSVKCNASSIC